MRLLAPIARQVVRLLAPIARQVLTEMNTSLLLDTGSSRRPDYYARRTEA